MYQYYIDSGYKNYRICKPLNILQHTKGAVLGLDDFVISEIEKMLDNDRYAERFKEYLKEALIGLERETENTYPTLKKKETELRKEIDSILDELLKVKSDALRERLTKKEAELERLNKEIRKYQSISSQPSKVLLLVNEYARVLKNIGKILKTRTPGEQKTAIGYFLDRIEILREEGVARCYFYDTPKLKEIDYLLPVTTSEACVPQYGAEGGTRTPTAFPPLEPESSASANSATSAMRYIIFMEKTCQL